MASNHGLSRAVLRVYTRVLLDVYRRGARARGIDDGQGVPGAGTSECRRSCRAAGTPDEAPAAGGPLMLASLSGRGVIFHSAPLECAPAGDCGPLGRHLQSAAAA